MARLLIGNFKGIKGDKGEKGDDGVIDSNSIISFEDYTNSTPPPTDMALGSIKTGKSISSLLSNIKALLMSTLTTSKLANNLNTNQEGFALDARMGKQLGDSVGAINDTLTTVDSRFAYDQLASWTTAELTANTLKSANWNSYESLIFEYRVYNNVYATITVKTSYFAGTTPGSRVLFDRGSGITVEIYQNGTNQIKVVSSNTFANSNLFVYGFIKK